MSVLDRRRGPGRALLASFSLLLGLVGALTLAGPALAGPAGGAGPRARTYYLDIGGSASVGLQPTAAHPKGWRTDRGYANDLVVLERRRWPGLTLVELGCPGESTLDALSGAGPCRYRDGSQLEAAVRFLASHRRRTVLATVDLGFNDLIHCLPHRRVHEACVERALRQVGRDLPILLTRLRAAGGPGLSIVGLLHYDPFLALDRRGRSGRLFAGSSLELMGRLNALLSRVYEAAGIRVAQVAPPFGVQGVATTGSWRRGRLLRAAADVCHLTWMCRAGPEGPNLHPNDRGYRVMAEAIAAALAPSGPVTASAGGARAAGRPAGAGDSDRA